MAIGLKISETVTQRELIRFLKRKKYMPWLTALKQANFYLAYPDGNFSSERYGFAWQNVNDGWEIVDLHGNTFLIGNPGLSWLKRNYTRHLNIFPDMLQLLEYCKLSGTGMRKILENSTVLINNKVNLNSLIERFQYYYTIAYFCPDSKPINLLYESAILSNFHEAQELKAIKKTVLSQ